MNNNNNFLQSRKWFWTKFWVGFFSVVAVGFAGAILIKEATGGGSGVSSLPAPRPDDISVDASNTQIVDDKTDGYYFSMPASWYFEKNAGAGVTVYSDYDPATASTAACKIEISAFAVGDSGADLNSWLANHLQADPTANISETSLSPIEISGASAALEWRGTMNGATTTLVYAQASGSGADEKILEIAPSSLNQASDADNDDCDPALTAFLSNLTFGTYEK